MFLVVEKAGEPGVGGPVAELGGAGLGAERKPGEIERALVMICGVVGHHLLELVCSGFLEITGFYRFFAVADELRLAEHASVAHRADEAQQGIGADHVGRLADPRPAELRIADELCREAAGSRRDAVQLLRIDKAEVLHIAQQLILPEADRKLREGDVAGIGERLLEGLRIVLSRADDRNPGNLVLALAVEAELVDVGDVFDDRRGGDELEYGARRKTR